MNGVTISFDKSRTYINLQLNPSDFTSEVDSREIRKQLESGETKRLYVSEKALKSACDTANHYFKTGDSTVVQERIGERKNAEIEFRIPEDSDYHQSFFSRYERFVFYCSHGQRSILAVDTPRY